MTQTEADRLVRALLRAAQKTRSNMREMGLPDSVLELLQPWLFGMKSVVPALIALNNRIDNDGHVGPMELFNLLWVIAEGADLVGLQLRLGDGTTLPALSPMPNWIGQFAEEGATIRENAHSGD